MPRSTLFPYTTLFRSWPSGQLLFVLGGFHAVFILAEWPETGHSVVAQTTVGVTENLGLRVREVKARRLTLCFGRTWLRLHRQDRKSTRLNSSHVAISYAALYTLSLHDALPILAQWPASLCSRRFPCGIYFSRVAGNRPLCRCSNDGWSYREFGVAGAGSESAQIDAMLRADVAALTSSRSEEHTSELQSRGHLVCRALHSFPTRRSSDLGPVASFSLFSAVSMRYLF